jgi:hypothetical protein
MTNERQSGKDTEGSDRGLVGGNSPASHWWYGVSARKKLMTVCVWAEIQIQRTRYFPGISLVVRGKSTKKLMAVCVWAEIQIQRTTCHTESRSVTLEPACSIIWYNLKFFEVSF